jgi:putative membrane protein
VLTVTLFSVGVVYAHDKGKPVTLTNSVTPLLAVVVSYSIVEDVACNTYGV